MDVSTLAVALGYTKKQIEQAKREGFKVQVEQDRNILETTGEEKIFYFLPKNPQKPKDGYDEFVYANNNWEQVGVTDVDLSSYGAALSLEDGILSLLSSSGAVLSQVLIDRTDLSDGVVTLNSSSFVYDETIKNPTVTSVVLNGVTLIANEDYKIVSTGATDAGNYILQIKGKNTYKGTIDVPWSITKATPTITGPSAITINTLNETKEETFTSNSSGYFSFRVENTSLATVSYNSGTISITSVAKGETNLIVNVAETLNYYPKQISIPLTILDSICFGVVWDYGNSSPVLTRLTRENDPNHMVTHSPTTEPTACVGTTAGQSWFDDYMPWAGMERKNYVNGEIVDFVDYNNGETFVYIPEFWSKIVNDTANSKMYFYIASNLVQGFTLHKGSGRYVARYQCNNEFKSIPGTTPKVNTNLGEFRTGITAIDDKHYQYDIHTYSALQLLYIVEFANLNTQAAIGAGLTATRVALTTGNTDILTYHTGRVSGTDNVSAMQYRWIENLWGNVSVWIDGILIQNSAVYICDDETLYSSSITNSYTNTGITTTTTHDNFLKTLSSYDDQYTFPKTAGGSDSTYLCDKIYYSSGLCGLNVCGNFSSGYGAGLFSWGYDRDPDSIRNSVGGRSVLVDN